MFIKKVRTYIETNHLLRPGQKVLVGVSGGADSMVLLHTLKKLQYSCVVAHMNFSLRGADSDMDEAFVEKYCQTQQLPFFSKKVDTLRYSRANGLSMEMAARELRYRFFYQLMDEQQIEVLAVGHHQTDQAETLLINLTRGTGLRGLSGMQPKTGKIIRPFLGLTNAEILEYANQQGITFRTDESNTDIHIIRNRIRHEVVPELEKINPSLVSTLSDTSIRLSKIQQWLDASVKVFAEKYVSIDKEATRILRKAVQAETHPEVILFELLYPLGFNPSQIEEISIALNSEQNGAQWFTAEKRLWLGAEELLIESTANQPSEKIYTLKIEETEVTEPIKLRLERTTKTADVKFKASPEMAYFDADKLKFPLTLRHWKQGDKFVPFGMKGSKKLSDFFIDQKFSPRQKEKTFVLLSGDHIIWVVGHRADNRYRVTSKTKELLTFQLLP